tara:strand:+ start:882 stop:1394 length:513 start_codon:yes stop_codon:yes gene_type:complete
MDIAEFDFEISILPAIALRNVAAKGIDAYLSPDLQEIHIDQHTFLHVPARATFSVAHELAHVVLHGDAYEQLAAGLNLREYRELMANLDQKDLGFIEWQANYFAGHVLVPSSVLRENFTTSMQQLNIEAREGATLSDGDAEAVIQSLKDLFGVSADVIRIRSSEENLVSI